MDTNKLVAGSKRESRGKVPPSYTALSEGLRQITPHVVQCAVFCGGSRCKYETPDSWPTTSQAIQGLYSHWITDDILAMSRPSTLLIVKKNIIQQFHSWGIKTIINLQTPGEHANCGPQLESSGFTYDPTMFMANNLHCYNFAWKDYGEATQTSLLDMVKVLDFAVHEGRVAVHCHAGLGRTGVLLSCYLVYTLRVRANDAIRFVRLKRPNSVQTRGQILCVQQFEQYILPQTHVFSHRGDHDNKEKKHGDFTLKQYLHRQRVMLHGYDERTFKHLPKIVYVICERLLRLCDCQQDDNGIDYTVSPVPFSKYFLSAKLHSKQHGEDGSALHSPTTNSESSPSDTNCSTRCGSSDGLSDLQSPSTNSVGESENRSDMSTISEPYSDYSGFDDTRIKMVLGDGISEESISENACFKELLYHKKLQNMAANDSFQSYTSDDIVQALLADQETLDNEQKKHLRHFELHFNFRQTAWAQVNTETNINFLTALLFDWLENLKTPILNRDDLSIIVIWGSQVEECLLRLELDDTFVLEYLIRFVSRLQCISEDVQYNILRRLAAALTHQTVCINNTQLPSGKNFTKLREGTHGRLMDFLYKFLHLVEDFTKF